MWRRASLALAMLLATATPAAARNNALDYVGINLSGAEFSNEKLAKWRLSERYPAQRTIAAFADTGMNIVRLPINWQRLQPKPCGPLDRAALARLDRVVGQVRARGQTVIIDLHEFGFAYGELIRPGSTGMRCLADFWSRLARHVRGDDGVWLGLMNEPHKQTAAEWLPAINASIAAIRRAGSRQRVLIAGTHWDDVEKWVGTDNERDIGGHVVDPAANWVLELHYYFNPWKGPRQHARSVDQGPAAFAPVTAWARANRVRLFLGEIGVSPDPVSLTALDRTIDYLERNRDVWLGLTYWAHGEIGNAPFLIHLDRPQPSAQLAVLQRHLPPAVPARRP